jgi:hypothetical protein
VKGKTENALLQMPFKAAYMFRPAYIQPLHRIRTKTKSYAAFCATVGPLYPVWKLFFPRYVTTTECLGRTMLNVAKRGARLNPCLKAKTSAVFAETDRDLELAGVPHSRILISGQQLRKDFIRSR